MIASQTPVWQSSSALHGIDISEKRLDVARRYFGTAMDGVDVRAASITGRTPWPDKHFDVVFSMYCLEQIPDATKAAVAEMTRLARPKVVMIEPVVEFGRLAQRLYLYNADHTRELLRSICELGHEPARLEALDIQGNPVKQSSIAVIKCG